MELQKVSRLLGEAIEVTGRIFGEADNLEEATIGQMAPAGGAPGSWPMGEIPRGLREFDLSPYLAGNRDKPYRRVMDRAIVQASGGKLVVLGDRDRMFLWYDEDETIWMVGMGKAGSRKARVQSFESTDKAAYSLVFWGNSFVSEIEESYAPDAPRGRPEQTSDQMVRDEFSDVVNAIIASIMAKSGADEYVAEEAFIQAVDEMEKTTDLPPFPDVDADDPANLTLWMAASRNVPIVDRAVANLPSM